MNNSSQEVFIISGMGRDVTGLVALITSIISELRGNIINIEEHVFYGFFTIFIVADLSKSPVTFKDFTARMTAVAHQADLHIAVEKHSFTPRRGDKRPALLALLGKDRPGIVASVAIILADNGINIEHTNMIARGELFAMEMLIDISRCALAPEEIRNVLKKRLQEIAVSASLEAGNLASKSKKVIVFDMETSLLEQGMVDELIASGELEREWKKVTAELARYKRESKATLRKRTCLLKGVEVTILHDIARRMKVSATAEELLHGLKRMGYKLALISSGYTIFTDALKERCGFDYAFGNSLVIDQRKGVLTGDITGPIMSAKKKQEIISWLAVNERMTTDELITIGDTSHSRLRIPSSELEIGIDTSLLLQKFREGTLKKAHILGLIFCLGKAPV